MISRLTAFAACFAVLSAATITFAASTAQRETPPPAAAARSTNMPIFQLPEVRIVGRRAHAVQP